MSLLPRIIDYVRFAVILIAVGVSLNACGFQPLYGSFDGKAGQDAIFDKLSDIEIGNIPDQEGQHLRNLLMDKFYKKGRPADAEYYLSVDKLEETLKDLDITKSSDATRGQLKITTKISLKNREGKLLMSRELSSITSYDILASEFTNRVSEQYARNNAIQDIASQIETYISLYFNREKK